MSENFFSNLPRFDRGADEYTVPVSDVETVADAEEVPEVDTEAITFNEKLARLDQMIASLSAVVSQVDVEATQRMQGQLSAIAEKLFPVLGKEFLAEEIGRHLPELVPDTAPMIELRADADLAARLKAMVAQQPHLAERCTVIEDDAQGANRATVSWSEGGVDFDFSSLLEACLAQLKAA